MQRIGPFNVVKIERYDGHVIIGFKRDTKDATLCGIELDGGEHNWPSDTLRLVACERLGIDAANFKAIEVVNFTEQAFLS